MEGISRIAAVRRWIKRGVLLAATIVAVVVVTFFSVDLGRISIGNMHESMNIRGSTRFAVPGQPVENEATGLLAAPSNVGRYSRDEFTAITELGFNLGYRFNCCTQLNIGYTFIYWNDILSSGTAIDSSIGDDNGTARPQFTFRHSDFWVQGISLGLTREF